MRRAIMAAFAVVALSTALAGPALAGKPVKETFTFDDAFDIDCGGFVLHETFTQTVTAITWTAADGSVRIKAHDTLHGTITGPGGILTLADNAHWNDFILIDAAGNETVTQIGLVYSFQVPGVGLVGHDVGSITFFPDGSAEFKGPHDIFVEGLEPLICPLFE
jgi:hypothetical protein